MAISHKKLNGLDEARILAIVEPILESHRVDAVEFVWRGDPSGQLLELTLEKPGSTRSGEGITIDLCSEISREISAQLDEQEVIPAKFRLEVGSPGVERALYNVEEYRRFAGQEAKLKMKEAMSEEGFIGQKTVRGTLFGVEGDDLVVISTDHGDLRIAMDRISSARLVFSWGPSKKKAPRKKPIGSAGPKAKKN